MCFSRGLGVEIEIALFIHGQEEKVKEGNVTEWMT